MDALRLGSLQSFFQSITDSLSVARVLYTLILLAVILFLLTIAFAVGRELVVTWGRGRTYLGEFVYFTNGNKAPEYGEQIRDESILFYRYIQGTIQSEKDERNQSLLTRSHGDDYQPEAQPKLIVDKQGALPEIDVTIQGVSVKAVMSYFVNLISPTAPEVSATIIKNDSTRRVYVSLPDEIVARSEGDHGKVSSPFILEGSDDDKDSDTAFRLGCFLIWSQSDIYRRDASQRDFCDWAKLLRIKSSFAMKEPNKTATAATNPDLEFLKLSYERAINHKIDYLNMVSTLSGVEKFIGKETILIAGKTATVDSVSDLVRYFGILGNNVDEDPEWYKRLPNSIAERRTADEAYFASRVSLDCKDGKAEYPNVVRIIVQRANEEGGTSPLVLSGIVLSDDTVLSIYLWRMYPDLQKDDVLKNVKIQTISCNKITGEFGIAAADLITGTKNFAAFVLLKVPGIKVSSPAPQFNFNIDCSQYCLDSVTIVGFIGNRKSTYGSVPEPVVIDNNERFVIADASEIKTIPQSTYADGQRLLFDSPYSLGMIGGPIYYNGQIVGMVLGGIPVKRGSSLRLTDGVLVSSLKSTLSPPQSPTVSSNK